MPRFRTFRDALVFLLVLTLVLFLVQKLGLADLSAGAVQVVDGDSLRKGDTDIRFYGIDAPEYRQSCYDRNRVEYPCGKKAANILRDLVMGHAVSCTSIDTGRYGRAVSTCKINSLDLNGEMVRQGWAVAYVRHSMSQVKLEAEARRARRGIWAGSFENPEDYRARTRSIHGDLTGEKLQD